MASREPVQPRWPKGSTEDLETLVNEFRSNLRLVAVRFAKHEHSENVLKRHVEESFAALVALGIRRQRWWKKSELEVAVGGFLVGFTLALPDLVSFFFSQDSAYRTGITSGVMVGCFVIGIFLSVHGWFRGKL